jgi:hypothetical protein
VNAAPLLTQISRVLARHRLEAVVIGNAAAALQGSPVTTMDVDFMFRKTPTNLRKLKAVADELDAMVLRPYYPASALYRVVRDQDGLQLDFMAKVDGVRSFAALKARATPVRFGADVLRVASLRDGNRTMRARGARSVAPGRRCRGQHSKNRTCVKPAVTESDQKRKPSALARESERALVEQIRRLLALPPHERTHFLRVRLPNGGSAL